MSTVAGALHGPDLPPAGAPCQVTFAGDALRIEGPLRFDVPAETIAVSVGGFDDDMPQLTFTHQDQPWSVVVADPRAHDVLLADAPASLTGQLRKSRGAVRYHRGKWQLVLGTLGVIVFAVLLGWWQSEALTAWVASKVSQPTEVSIGESALAQLELEHDLTQTGLAAQTVAAIGAKLTAGSRYDYRWYVSDDKEVNAYALPGGIVVINAGLIDKAGSADELAAVIAHEVQHVEHRHTLQQMIHAAGWAAVVAVALGDVSAITVIVVHQLGTMRNSRKLESEADVEGLKAMARVGIPLDAMVKFMRALRKEAERMGGEGIALLSTHPATTERIAELEQLARTLTCTCRPLEYDWAAVRADAKSLTRKG